MDNLNDLIKIPLELSPTDIKNNQKFDEEKEMFFTKLGVADCSFIAHNFQLNGHIKFNQYFLDPLSLPTFKYNLNKVGVKNFIFYFGGVIFFFEGFSINFIGNIHVMKNIKYFCVEIDYKVGLMDDKCKSYYERIMEEIRKFDTLYFYNKLSLIENIKNKVEKDCLLN